VQTFWIGRLGCYETFMGLKPFFAALVLVIFCGCATVSTVPLNGLASLAPNTTARFLFPSAGGTAEGYLVRPRGSGTFPLMVLLHGHSFVGIGARRVLPAADAFANEVCYASLAVSLPGYGDTDVRAGPLAEITRQVVLDAIATARQLPWVDAKQIYLYGFSRGAVVAAALIGQMDGIKGALLHSGAYDLQRLYQDTSSFWLRRLLNPKGDANPRLRNLLPEAANWQASTLILHGEQDTFIPVSQATLLRDRLQNLGKPHRLVLFPEYGHRLPLAEIKETAMQFLKDNGGSACALSAP
jgi:dipeptidyl aminopeptidase/acylaminoacyl peptidase